MKKKGLALVIFSTAFLLTGLIVGNKLQKKELIESKATVALSDAPIEAGETLDMSRVFLDTFDSGISFDDWAVSEWKWGQNAQGGIRHENVFYNSVDDTVIFRALGDYYTEHEFVNTNEGIHSNDGTRTGGCIVSQDYYGPGRFEIRMKAAPVEGVCSAFWLYNYGTNGANYYNEIDFELPGDTASGDPKFSFNSVICSTYVAEVVSSNPRVTNPTYLNDGQFHTYIFDWYYSSNHKMVNYYIDDVLICTNSANVSPYDGRIWIGCWLPYNANFVGLPNFDKAYMELDYFRYIPFTNQQDLEYETALGNQNNQYTTVTSSFVDNLAPNGKFPTSTLGGYTKTNDVEVSKSYNHSGDDTYGVKIAGAGNSNESKLSTTLSNVYGINKVNLSFDYKGRGSAKVKCNGSDVVFNSGNLTSTEGWTTLNQEVELTPSAKTLTLELISSSSGTGLQVDNIQINISGTGITYPTSHSFFTKGAEIVDTSWGEKQIKLDGVNTYQLAGGRYWSKNGMTALAVAPNTNVMDSTSDSKYYPFKQALLAASFAEAGEKVSLLYQTFNTAYFVDFEVTFKAYETASRSYGIMYSVDDGASWNIIKTLAIGSFEATDETGFELSFTASASEIPQADRDKPIRFAVFGNLAGNDDSDCVTSITVNNYNDIKNRLDTSGLCLAGDSIQEMLAHEYGRLSDEEKSLFATEQMKNYPHSYATSYTFLVSLWSGGNGAQFFETVKENSGLISAAIVTALSILAFMTYAVLKKKRA